MDAQAIGARIKSAREAKGLTQENLAAMVDLSTTHISVIERGCKSPKLETFILIANALEVSADTLLADVVDNSYLSVSNELNKLISQLPKKQQKKILNAVKALVE